MTEGLTRRRAIAGGAAMLAAPRIARAQAMREMNYFLVSNIFGMAAYVAAENGLWAQHGIDVKLRITGSGREVTQAMQAGQAQIGHVAFSTTAAAARASGNLLKGIIPYLNDARYVGKASAMAIIGRKDRGIDAADATSFHGKTAAFLTGSSTEVQLKEWLRRRGADTSKVKLVSVPVENMPITLAQGLADVVSVWEPYVSQILREQGANAVLVSRGEPGLMANVIGAMANQDWLAKNEDFAELFATGLAEAAQFVRQNPEETGDILTRYLDGVKREDAIEAVKHGDWDTRLSLCTAQGIVDTGNTMAATGLIKIAKPFVVADFFDPTALDRVQQKHPEFFSDLPPLPPDLAACKGKLSA